MTNAKDLVLGKTYYIDNVKDIAGEFIMRGKGSIFFKINWSISEYSTGGYHAPDGIIELSDTELFKFNEKTE
jgi:hypothetical protein